MESNATEKSGKDIPQPSKRHVLRAALAAPLIATSPNLAATALGSGSSCNMNNVPQGFTPVSTTPGADGGAYTESLVVHEYELFDNGQTTSTVREAYVAPNGAVLEVSSGAQLEANGIPITNADVVSTPVGADEEWVRGNEVTGYHAVVYVNANGSFSGEYGHQNSGGGMPAFVSCMSSITNDIGSGSGGIGIV